MRALKIATLVMAVLIVVGTTVLIVEIVRRMTGVSPSAAVQSAPLVLDEPAGTRIAGIAAVRDRLALRLQGGGSDRVVLIDPVSGVVAGRISLAR